MAVVNGFLPPWALLRRPMQGPAMRATANSITPSYTEPI